MTNKLLKNNNFQKTSQVFLRSSDHRLHLLFIIFEDCFLFKNDLWKKQLTGSVLLNKS